MKSFEDFKAEVDVLSHEDLATEVVDWMINNVESYIDNHETVFRLALNVGSEEAMPVAYKIEQLFIELAETFVFDDVESLEELTEGQEAMLEEETQRSVYLHKFIDKAHSYMQESEEHMNRLFEKLKYYYELVGFRKGQPVMKSLVGTVKVTTFLYEPVEIEVTITPKTPIVDENGKTTGEMEEGEPEVRNMPAGYAVEIVLDLRDEKIPTSIF
jgi:hypothetical protein